MGMVSLAGRRFGPAVSGWLVGLPLASAPITLFLAIEQGAAFASSAAHNTLLGMISIALYCVTYSWLSFRVNWLGCWLGSWGLFFAATFGFEHFSVPLLFSFLGAVSSLLLAFILLSKQYEYVVETQPPAWEMVGRMLVVTCFILILTETANALGPRLSGLLSPFPIFATIVAIFTHHFQGAAAARRVLYGVVIGGFGTAVFSLLVAGLLGGWGIAAAFGVASLVTLFVQGCLFWLLRRRRKRTKKTPNTSRRVADGPPA